jgi:hypothetical protein
MARIVLRSGFSTIIFENYNPRPSTKRKGKKLQEGQHLFNVEEVRCSGKPTEITARCCKQTNVTDSPWFLNIVIDDARKVTLSHCSCPGGGDGQCKHMFSLIDKINDEREESKTDSACSWITAPSAYGKRLYPKGKTFDDIFNNPEKSAKVSFTMSQEEKDAHFEDLEAAGDSHSMTFRLLKKMKVCSILKRSQITDHENLNLKS